MENIGQLIRRLREEKGEPLRKVAEYLDIDQAILSKIERGQRKSNKKQIEKLAKYFGADKKEMLVAWLRDRILYEILDEELGEEALKAAEEKIRYLRMPKINMTRLKIAIAKELNKYPVIEQAWLFGSFARGEENYKSDVDLMIDVPGKNSFSMFDAFQIQEDLQNIFKRKFDIVMAGALKPFAWETAKNDLKLIYERSD
ncbi:MAG: nucleotidyltransferase domain-containing protein [Cyclobacteriaceae bacterium]|nr:nucleotidyltransferase domain-containing protein [Cyclobacteriaceae bacterium]